jgi:hypothetical protein
MSHRLDELIKEGRLSSVAVILGPRDQINRRLYWTTEFEQWCRQMCKSPPKTRSLIDVPTQINAAFAEFVTGRPLSSGLARCDPPRGQALWRIKTPDLRLYGWADEEQCMILAIGELKSIIVARGYPKDADMGRKAVEIRNGLKLGYLYGERYELFPVTC